MRHWTLEVRTREREQMIDITDDVAALIDGAGSGIVTVFVPHTSAGVTINENADEDVQTDMLGWLAKLVPNDPSFRHAERNSDAHIKASLMGASAQIPVVEGRMMLGQWQAVYFCEFDGPRSRRVQVAFTE